jgi:FMN phosphatase YigB (HAD superfamily)
LPRFLHYPLAAVKWMEEWNQVFAEHWPTSRTPRRMARIRKDSYPMATQDKGREKRPFDDSPLPFRLRAPAFPPNHQRRIVRATRPVRGLLLDAGNILYDDTDWRRWLLRVLARLGMRTEYNLFFRILDRDYLDAVFRGQRPFNEAMDEFLIAAGLSPGQADEAHRALESHRHQSDAHPHLLIGVRETLTQLRAAGVKLGVLCNCEHPGETIRKRLDELLGESPWTAVISSRDLGRTMPDAACYRAALEAIQLPAADAGFVGHNALELRGAKLQGLCAIAFNSDPDARADVYLQRFEDLLELTRFSPGFPAAA